MTDKSLYSAFRYPNPKYVGFSPIVAQIVSEGHVIKKIYESKNKYKLHNLLDFIFHRTDVGIVISQTYRNVLHLIAMLDLLPKLIKSCMLDTESITRFFDIHSNYIINEYKRLYEIDTNRNCSKRDISNCETSKKSKCVIVKDRDNVSCGVRQELFVSSEEARRNLTKFIKSYIRLKDTLVECYIESYTSFRNPYTSKLPYYLFGMTLSYYWFISRKDVDKKIWVSDYIDQIGLTKNLSDTDIDETEDILSNIRYTTPPIITMTSITFRNINFPNCVETVLNDFFNVMLYDGGTKTFDISLLPRTANSSLISYYRRVNSMLNSREISINDVNIEILKIMFLDVVIDIPGVRYRQDGFNIVSENSNVMKVFSYLVGFKINSLEDLEKLSSENQNIEVDGDIVTFNHRGTIKKIKIDIQLGHSNSEHIMIDDDKKFRDNIAYIIYNFVFKGYEDEFISEYPIEFVLSNLNFEFIKQFNSQEDLRNYVDLPLIMYSYESKLPQIVLDIISKSRSMEICRFDDYYKTNLPSFVSNFINLNKLEMTYSSVEELPDYIYSFKKLTTLSAGNSGLSWKKLSLLTNLVNFSAKLVDRDSDVEPDIKYLTNLEKLSLRNVSSLPNEIKYLTKLNSLTLHNSPLEELPNEISYLTNIREIYLLNTKIIKPLSNVFTLTNLEVLSVANGRLKQIPPSISILVNLKTLSLQYLNLKEIPPEIKYLTKLEILVLSHNKIESIPSEIKYLENLHTLRLDNNMITDLPSEILKLKKLRTFKIRKNPLKSNEIVDILRSRGVSI